MKPTSRKPDSDNPTSSDLTSSSKPSLEYLVQKEYVYLCRDLGEKGEGIGAIVDPQAIDLKRILANNSINTPIYPDHTFNPRLNPYTVFVKGVLPGEVAQIKLTLKKKKYGMGILLKLLKTNPERKSPRCFHFNNCGSCQLQHLSYLGQLKWKDKKVKDALKRIAKIDPSSISYPHKPKIDPIMPSPDIWQYRNKASFPIRSHPTNGVVAGYYHTSSHKVIDIKECHVQMFDPMPILNSLKNYLKQNKIPAYLEQTKQGILRHIQIRYTASTSSLFVTLVLTKASYTSLFEDWLDSMIQNTHVVGGDFNIQPLDTNVILGEKTIPRKSLAKKSLNKKSLSKDHLPSVKVKESTTKSYSTKNHSTKNHSTKSHLTLKEDETLKETIGTLSFIVSSKSFLQINKRQTEQLYTKVLDFIPKACGVIFDLYCGIGTITQFIAHRATKVIGFEIVAEAIENAFASKALNNINNVDFILGNVCEQMDTFKRLHPLDHPELIIVDPPRKGLDEELIKSIIGLKAKRIIYISCKPSTWARDIHSLTHCGYELSYVQPFDMFPQTTHVEILSVLDLI